MVVHNHHLIGIVILFISFEVQKNGFYGTDDVCWQYECEKLSMAQTVSRTL